MNTMTWSMALAVALALAGAPGQAQGKLPRSVAEQRAMAETSGRWPSFRLPPGNVRSEDYRALLGNTVVVSGVFGATGIARYALQVVFIGRDGRYLWCIPRAVTYDALLAQDRGRRNPAPGSGHAKSE